MRRRFCGGTSHISDMLEKVYGSLPYMKVLLKEIGTTIGS